LAHDGGREGSTEAPKSVAAPSISLPKGGGAIRGIGEKFAANPVTGTGSMSVPIATSPGRSGFGPQLALSYDSGSGNSPFGFGWSLSLPSITRKTDKGLPQYNDAAESDVFILSGAEDLVPVLKPDGTREVGDASVAGYTILRYRPRIEGLFARIERWTRQSDGDVHWRSISKDNILTLYGKDSNSRISDSDSPAHVFSWLMCETRDDKGNAVIYDHKPEDGTGVVLTRAHEANRGDRNDPRRAANRYLKRIRYGNRAPLLEDSGRRPSFLTEAQIQNAGWMFEVVFDYEDHDPAIPKPRDDEERDSAGVLKWPWTFRQDPFAIYRSGFEVRTTRVCQRVLMFHHFPGEAGVGSDCLVRSTDFTYSHEEDPTGARNPVYTFLRAVTQTGYRRNNGGYEKRSLPQVEFEYTQPVVQGTVEEVDLVSLENLPIGVDGASDQWTDLHGEGIPGILTEQADGWFYKRNLSPISDRPVELAPLERVATRPNLALAGGHAQFMDLAGDGQPDVVVLDGSMPGLYEHDEGESWQPFRPFTSRLNRDMRDANLKLVDMDGDGHADVLITEDNAFVWHPSLAEAGFGAALRVVQPLDEEKGPRLVFADGTQSVYLADLSGDGLTDLLRIRNGEVCYWPNLGYGRFGAKVTMDHAPQFDNPDQFDHKRIRLADIDGSGTTDIIYLHRDRVRLYFNQSGNSWSEPQELNVFPRIDDLASIVPTDLLGNGTACLVWSSALPGDSRRPMRYVNLMGGQKPHLLVKTWNNLGAETVVQYAPSTKFYLQDKRDGKPWITRLPFPVHVVERVQIHDYISRNRFVTRYAYHHGYFDGEEREFRGFGMVEQRDTEELAALTGDGVLPPATNFDAASHVPPVLNKTWFHTGVYLGRDHVSDFFAGLVDAQEKGEYYREPGLTDAQARALLLPDTVLPSGLTLEEEREACRALKGSMLRQEVYALDGSNNESHPYTVTEQSFSIRTLQRQASNRHAVFFTHAREAINFHYERSFLRELPDQRGADPRIQHALTLEVDDYGNVLKEAAIGYGRRQTIRVVDVKGQVQQLSNPGLNALAATDQLKQTTLLATYSENRVTAAVETTDSHRNPLPCEARVFELTGYPRTGPAARFQASDLVEPDPHLAGGVRHIFLGERRYEEIAAGNKLRRPIELTRTLYRRNDLTALCPLGELEWLALPGESYKLAFTPGLLSAVYQRPQVSQPSEALISDPATILGGQGGDRGGYVQSQALKADGRFPNLDADDHWWIPSGRSFFTNDPNDGAATEFAAARKSFFLPERYRDPFAQDAYVSFDPHKLLIVESRDALDNRITVQSNDYRVLQPRVVSDPNRNQTTVAFDALGLVVGTAVMGKPLPAPAEGDSLVGFAADLTQVQIEGFHDSPDPHATAPALLQNATTRIVYDLDLFRRTQRANPKDPTKWLATYAATLARETHASDPLPPEGLKIQISFSYSDGFSREIQKKIQAEAGPLVEGGPEVRPRWVGSGWTIFNNKGKPVRQYEPFFSTKHRFEFGVEVGVSPILFYDPVERVIATLRPNHTYEKMVFGPWLQMTWDVNDTTKRPDNSGDPPPDPRNDSDVGHYFARLPLGEYLPTWYDLRTDPVKALQAWPDVDAQGKPLPDNVRRRAAEERAAAKAAAHADTPTTAHFDTLGRPFLTLADNGLDPMQPGQPLLFTTRVELDIEGNQRSVRDAIEQAGDPQGRIVMRYTYDMLGGRIHQLSMEAGTRWILNDVAGKPVRAWDSRGHSYVTAYDALRRPVEQYVRGVTSDSDPRTLNLDILIDKIEYGEGQVNSEGLNLRTRIYRHSDSAGVATNAARNPNSSQTEAYDFKGNRLRSARQLVSDCQAIPDWVLDPQLEDETFTTSTRYDALNRPVQSIAPHSDVPHGDPGQIKLNVIQPVFNEANLLERVEVWLGRAVEPGGLLDSAIEAPSSIGISNIDYDAKGQRQRIDYRNGASTLYGYDDLTLRLVHLRTRRNTVAFPDDCPQSPPAGWPGCQVQSLRYTYDPVGNIINIRDDAQQTIFFKNRRVEPSSEYSYDAIYRLIEATGREHLGQTGSAIPHSSDDASRVGIWISEAGDGFHPNDRNAMGRYCENYSYDAAGNLMEMIHRPSCPGDPSWTRSYSYEEPCLIEDGSGGWPLKTSNRLSRTIVGNGDPVIERYAYDGHGNMTRMPQLDGTHPAPNMHWDYRDQLRQTDLVGGNTAYYVYDAAGQRVRKVCEKAAGLTEERIYLGGFEIFRRHGGAIGANSATLERETLHIMDDEQRIALVETLTLDAAGDDPAPSQLIRYQFGNHLGSVTLELDDQAKIISYEEYTPYGSTSYQAVRGQTEAPKRYRFSGKERDEESGLNYHGARYYALWIGRWVSCDPTDIKDGINPYAYVHDRPTRDVDPTGKAAEVSVGLSTKVESVKIKVELKKKPDESPTPKFNVEIGPVVVKVDKKETEVGVNLGPFTVGTAGGDPKVGIGTGAKIKIGKFEAEAKVKAEARFRVLADSDRYSPGSLEIGVDAKLKGGPAEVGAKKKVYEAELKFGTGTSDSIRENRQRLIDAAPDINAHVNIKTELQQDQLEPPSNTTKSSTPPVGFWTAAKGYWNEWKYMGSPSTQDPTTGEKVFRDQDRQRYERLAGD
jgi:RHS repeat-associated protein